MYTINTSVHVVHSFVKCLFRHVPINFYRNRFVFWHTQSKRKVGMFFTETPCIISAFILWILHSNFIQQLFRFLYSLVIFINFCQYKICDTWYDTHDSQQDHHCYACAQGWCQDLTQGGKIQKPKSHGFLYFPTTKRKVKLYSSLWQSFAVNASPVNYLPGSVVDMQCHSSWFLQLELELEAYDRLIYWRCNLQVSVTSDNVSSHLGLIIGLTVGLIVALLFIIGEFILDFSVT